MKIEGACYCGEIVYEAELDLDKVGICHCTDCQTLSSSAFRTIATIAGDTFKVLQGTPKDYIKIGDSGNKRIQAFCGNCGSSLYATSVGDGPKNYNIRVGTIRQHGQIPPKFECWRQSALDWLPEISHTVKFDQAPE